MRIFATIVVTPFTSVKCETQEPIGLRTSKVHSLSCYTVPLTTSYGMDDLSIMTGSGGKDFWVLCVEALQSVETPRWGAAR